MKGKFQYYFNGQGTANFRKSGPYQGMRNNKNKPKKSIFEKIFEGLCCAEGDNFYNV